MGGTPHASSEPPASTQFVTRPGALRLPRPPPLCRFSLPATSPCLLTWQPRQFECWGIPGLPAGLLHLPRVLSACLYLFEIDGRCSPIPRPAGIIAPPLQLILPCRANPPGVWMAVPAVPDTVGGKFQQRGIVPCYMQPCPQRWPPGEAATDLSFKLRNRDARRPPWDRSPTRSSQQPPRPGPPPRLSPPWWKPHRPGPWAPPVTLAQSHLCLGATLAQFGAQAPQAPQQGPPNDQPSWQTRDATRGCDADETHDETHGAWLCSGAKIFGQNPVESIRQDDARDHKIRKFLSVRFKPPNTFFTRQSKSALVREHLQSN